MVHETDNGSVAMIKCALLLSLTACGESVSNITPGSGSPGEPLPATGSIGDLVWNDLNQDGLIDTGEDGIEAVRIVLEASGGELLAETLTTAGGAYLFEGVEAGTYTVRVDESTLPPDFVASPCDVGGNDSLDSDCSPVTVVLPEDDTEIANVDFGYYSLEIGQIGDVVWFDHDRDGVQDAGEPGIEMIGIVLRDDATGEVVQTTTSGEGGAYSFQGLASGVYVVDIDIESVPPGFFVTDCEVGGDETQDSNCLPALVVLSEEAPADPTIDFGYQSSFDGQIGDFVWNDLDEDGIQDAEELGLPFVRMQLFDELGIKIQKVTADEAGRYLFVGLDQGNYTVTVREESVPGALVPTLCDFGEDDELDSECSPASVPLPTEDTIDLSIDFGFTSESPCRATVGDFVWFDSNCNGLQDPGEPGLENIRIVLYDGDGDVLQRGVTDSTGWYEFVYVCPGDYIVTIDSSYLPPDYITSDCDVGSDDELDSECSPYSLVIDDPDQMVTGLDFGFCSTCDGTIGDFVWNDIDGDGTQRPAEPGMGGVKVTLEDELGQLLAEVTTDADGRYFFGGLCAGTYFVEVDPTSLPPGSVETICNAGPDPADDSECGRVLVELLDDTARDETIDFGFIAP
ncbi:MAG: SdrD B-like domain-containing protein [Planctomycetota bacterium]|nr:SdrD B-like domain-containing protein [Planctomycetota bacterium]